MKTQSIAPTGQVQPFEVNETFFSTTDLRGVITAGNQVFCRTSGFALAEMVGQPHNLIRHPNMPRLVFRQLWETVKRGQPFMGYVKNHAKNGNHYWVFAIIVPLQDAFLSVRIKPTSALLATIEPLYQQLLSREQEAIASGSSESNAAAATTEFFRGEISRLGFSGYEAFSHHALNTEIKSRDQEIAARRLRLFPAKLDAAGCDATLRSWYDQALSTYSALNTLFESLDTFLAMRDGIRERKDAVQSIAEEFRLNALNAHIAANPLGEQGITLGTVAQLMNGHGQMLSRNVASLATSITGTTGALADIASNLSSARIQLEMLLTFLAEVAHGRQSAAETQRLLAMAQHLRAAFGTTLDYAIEAIAAVQRHIPTVLTIKEQLRRDVIFLQVAQISGLTEVARLRNADGLHGTFTGLRGQIETGKRELDQLGGVVEQLRVLTNTTPPQVQSIRHAMRKLISSAGGNQEQLVASQRTAA